jgi:ABC-2 type transport system permease protein
MRCWLQAVARVNPLTYEVDALRALMLSGGTSVSGIGWNLLIISIATGLIVWIGTLLYPTVVF